MVLVVIGDNGSSGDSAELLHAQGQFFRSLPSSATTVRLLQWDQIGLAATVLQAAVEFGLVPDTRVLLAANPYLLPAPNALKHMEMALVAGATAAYACDSTHFPAHLPPSFLTVRGMERYAARLALEPDSSVQAGSPLPLLGLTTVGALCSGLAVAGAKWIAGAYVHDFSKYHQGARADVLPFVPAASKRVLDVGGGEGAFLAALKSCYGCEVHLSEFSNAAMAAPQRGIDKVWYGDFASVDFDVSFDCITFLDVLEHTENPLQWLKRAAQLLTPDGCVVASIPNVGHWSVVADLLEGRWDYAAAGIHCITHLRFFTRYGIEQLMSEAGFIIEKIEGVRITPPHGFDVSGLQADLVIDHENLSCVSYLFRARLSL